MAGHDHGRSRQGYPWSRPRQQVATEYYEGKVSIGPSRTLVLTESEESYARAAKAIKSLVFANRPCTRAWSTRPAIGHNLRVGQNIFSRKLQAKIQFPTVLFPSSPNIFSYNPHSILKNARRGRLKKYIYFYLQKLRVGPAQRQYATKNRARTNFLGKIWRINLGFFAPDQRSYSQIFKIVCTSIKFSTFHAKRRWK